MKIVLCADCPCLNEGECESTCNLWYDTDQDYLVSDGKWKYFSKNCALEEVKHKDGVFKPVWIEDEVVAREPRKLTPLETAWAERIREESMAKDHFFLKPLKTIFHFRKI